MPRANALRKMTLTVSTPYTFTSIIRIQTEPTLIAEYNRAPFYSLVDLFHKTRVAVLGGVVL